MRINFLLHPIRSWRARKLNAELKTEAQALHLSVASELEKAKRYEAYTRYGDLEVAARRKQLKTTLHAIHQYLQCRESDPRDRKLVNRLRGDFTESKVKLKEVIETDEHWRKQAEGLRSEIKASRSEAEKIDSPDFARKAAAYERNFSSMLHAARESRYYEQIHTCIGNAMRLVRTYAVDVQRARRVMDEFPGIRDEFKKIEQAQIVRDPQGMETYRVTLATLEKAEQKIEAGSFTEAEHKLKAAQANITHLQMLATRTGSMAEEQIQFWSEHARAHPLFQKKFGQQLDAAAHETPAKRSEAWSQVAQLILEWAMAASDTAWREDLPVARDLHPALEMPWPAAISEERNADVSWKKLVAYADAVSTATGRNWPFESFKRRLGRC